jgi:hypothetical protein
MNTGRYDQIISFIDLGFTSDGHGGTIPDRTTLLTTYSAVDQVTAGRTVEEMQQVINGMYDFRIKYRSDFIPTKNMLINYLGEDYTLNKPVLNPQRHKREWTIRAVRADNSDVTTT